MFLVIFVSAVTLDTDIILNTTSSNSSMTFSFPVTVNEVQVNNNSIFMHSLSYTIGGTKYLCGLLTHTIENSNLDSVDFNCSKSGQGLSYKIPGPPEIKKLAEAKLVNKTIIEDIIIKGKSKRGILYILLTVGGFYFIFGGRVIKKSEKKEKDDKVPKLTKNEK